MESVAQNPSLLLIPSPLGPDWQGQTLPVRCAERVRGVRHFAVEELREARRYLARLGMPVPIETLQIEVFDKDSTPADAEALLSQLPAGASLGVISGAGVPGVADPGALLVAEAHRRGMPVEPLVGPSSLLLTLMASGLDGQHFAFVGYLPIASRERIAAIRQLERRAQSEGQTQVFIETPYRNDALLAALLATLAPSRMLCIGYALQHPEAWVRTRPVAEWRAAPPHLGKRPAVFALR